MSHTYINFDFVFEIRNWKKSGNNFRIFQWSKVSISKRSFFRKWFAFKQKTTTMENPLKKQSHPLCLLRLIVNREQHDLCFKISKETDRSRFCNDLLKFTSFLHLPCASRLFWFENCVHFEKWFSEFSKTQSFRNSFHLNFGLSWKLVCTCLLLEVITID